MTDNELTAALTGQTAAAAACGMSIDPAGATRVDGRVPHTCGESPHLDLQSFSLNAMNPQRPPTQKGNQPMNDDGLLAAAIRLHLPAGVELGDTSNAIAVETRLRIGDDEVLHGWRWDDGSMMVAGAGGLVVAQQPDPDGGEPYLAAFLAGHVVLAGRGVFGVYID